MRARSLLLILAGAPLAACTTILGTYELVGGASSTSASTATGLGGAGTSSSTTSSASSSTASTGTGGTGPCVPGDLASLCTGKICSDTVTDGCGKQRRCGSCTAWSWVAPNLDINQSVRVLGVAVGADGVATLTGRCSGSIDFGDGQPAACGGGAVHLARVGAGGAASHLVSRRIWASPYPSAGNAVAVNGATGRILFAGVATSAINFGLGALPSNASGNGFLVAADTTLTPTIARGAVDTADNRAAAVAFAPAGDVYLAGGFEGAISWTGCNAVNTPSFPYDGFIAHFDADLQCQWLKRAGTDDADFLVAVTVAPDGDVVIAGNLGADTSNLLGCTGTQQRGPYVAKLAPGSQCKWVRSLAGADAPLSAMAVTPNGNIVVVGGFDGDLHLDATRTLHSAANVPTQAPSGEPTYDAFVVQLDSGGAVLGGRAFGDELFQLATSVAAAPNGDIVLTGRFWGTVDLGGRPFTNPNADPHKDGPNANTNGGGFVARFDGALGHRWSVGFTAKAVAVFPNGVAIGPSGQVVAAGDFWGMFDFGNGVTQSSAYSAFAVQLDP